MKRLRVVEGVRTFEGGVVEMARHVPPRDQRIEHVERSTPAEATYAFEIARRSESDEDDLNSAAQESRNLRAVVVERSILIVIKCLGTLCLDDDHACFVKKAEIKGPLARKSLAGRASTAMPQQVPIEGNLKSNVPFTRLRQAEVAAGREPVREVSGGMSRKLKQAGAEESLLSRDALPRGVVKIAHSHGALRLMNERSSRLANPTW